MGYYELRSNIWVGEARFERSWGMCILGVLGWRIFWDLVGMRAAANWRYVVLTYFVLYITVLILRTV